MLKSAVDFLDDEPQSFENAGEAYRAVSSDSAVDFLESDKPSLAERASSVVTNLGKNMLSQAQFIPTSMEQVKNVMDPMPGKSGVSGVLERAGERVESAIPREQIEDIQTNNPLSRRFPVANAAFQLPAALFLEQELKPSSFAQALPLAVGMTMGASLIGKGGAGVAKAGPIEVAPGKFAEFKRSALDRFEPIKRWEGKEIAPEFESVGGKYTQAYVDARTLSSKIKGRSTELLDGVNEAVKPLKNFEDRQLLNRVYSLKNFADLDRIGKTTSGITKEMAEAELQSLKKKLGDADFERINKVADDIADIQNSKGLDILVEGKVITQETANKLKERYPNYLRSEILDDQLSGEYHHFRNSNGEPIGKINRDFLKAKEGTELAINDDVLDVVRRSLISKVAAAEKQKVVDGIVETFGTQIGEQQFKGKKITIEVDEGKIPAGYVKSSSKASGGRVFAVSEEVENLLQGLNKQDADLVTKAVTKYNQVFRLGATTYRLPFAITNLARDIQTAIFNKRVVPGQTSQVGAYAKGLVSSIKESLGIKDATFEAWRKGGGAYGGLVTSIPKETKIPFRLKSFGEQLGSIATKPFTLPFEAVGKLAEVSENTSRLAEYLRLQKTELPEPLKVLNSRDITVDFEKMGDSMKVWNKWVPFLNANIQGTLNTARVFRDQPTTSLMRAGTFIAAPAIALRAWNTQFENDKYIDPYIKENFWYLNTGASVKRVGRDVPVLGLVRKGEFAKQLSQPIEALMEFSADDPNLKERLKEWSAQDIASSVVANFTPPPVRGVLEQVANYDYFRRSPIVPGAQKGVESGAQFKAGTTNTARRLGEMTGISPIRFEHALNSIFPGAGQVMEVSDLLAKPEPVVPRSQKDALQKSQAFQPVVRAPSGYFSPEESSARSFLEEKREETKTSKFLFSEAYKLLLEDRTKENLARVRALSENVSPKDRRDVIKNITKKYKNQSRPDRERAAFEVLPRKLRKEYLNR